MKSLGGGGKFGGGAAGGSLELELDYMMISA